MGLTEKKKRKNGITFAHACTCAHMHTQKYNFVDGNKHSTIKRKPIFCQKTKDEDDFFVWKKVSDYDENCKIEEILEISKKKGGKPLKLEAADLY